MDVSLSPYCFSKFSAMLQAEHREYFAVAYSTLEKRRKIELNRTEEKMKTFQSYISH